MQNRYFAYFSDFSHIGVDFRILICEFAYAWRPCIPGMHNDDEPHVLYTANIDIDDLTVAALALPIKSTKTS